MPVSLRFLPAFLLAVTLGVALVACGRGDTGRQQATAAAAVQTPGSGGQAAPGPQSASGGPVTSGFDTGAADQKVAIVAGTADAPLSWDKQVYTATAGEATFVVSNNSGTTQHQFTIRGNGVNAQSGQFNQGFTGQYTVRNLSAGEYDILCSFHEQAGMRAKLTVNR